MDKIIKIFLTMVLMSCGSLAEKEDSEEMGPQGMQGDVGTKGNDGEVGKDGKDGAAGAAGAAGFQLALYSSNDEILGYIVDLVGFMGQKRFKFVTEEGYWGVANLLLDRIELPTELMAGFNCMYPESDCLGQCYAWVEDNTSDHTGVILTGADGYYVAGPEVELESVVFKSYYGTSSCVNSSSATITVREAIKVDKFSDFPYSISPIK